MDNRWIWILLFCFAIMFAAWHLRERQSNAPYQPTLGAKLQPLTPSGRLWETLVARLDSPPSKVTGREAAIALALRTAYGDKKGWTNRPMETSWLQVSALPTSGPPNQQVALVTTLLPNDGLLALFSVNNGEYSLLDLTTDLSRIDSVSLEQVVADPPQEIAVTHTYDELLGAFFKITLCTLFKWSPKEQRLVTVWEYPLELEQYDIEANFEKKQTKRSQVKFGSNEITVYEVTTNWVLDRKLDIYQVSDTSVQNIHYRWDEANFTFTASTDN